MTSIDKIREGQELTLGRELEVTLVKRLAAGGKPYQDGDDAEGVSLIDGYDAQPLIAVLGVRLSERPRHSNGTVRITTLDEATTYTVTLNGTDYDYVTQAGDGVQDVLAGLASAIGSNEAGTPSTAVSPQVIVESDTEGTVTDERLDLLGGIDSTWTGAVSASGGTGTISYERDATTVDWRLWAKWPWGWALVPGEAYAGVVENEAERYVVAGAEGIYVEITSTDGRVYEAYGVGVLEEGA